LLLVFLVYLNLRLFPCSFFMVRGTFILPSFWFFLFFLFSFFSFWPSLKTFFLVILLLDFYFPVFFFLVFMEIIFSLRFLSFFFFFFFFRIPDLPPSSHSGSIRGCAALFILFKYFCFCSPPFFCGFYSFSNIISFVFFSFFGV